MSTFPPVHVILTGGTIDSYYEGSKDTVVPRQHSIIPDYFAQLKPYNEVTFSEICMKDSRDIGETERKAILETINDSAAEHFLITHGTYTMPDTARFLRYQLQTSNKVVVITGSMVPLSITEASDAGFNLGFAFSSTLNLDPGVYVCMNGRVFYAEEVTKAVEEGRFVSLFNREQ